MASATLAAALRCASCCACCLLCTVQLLLVFSEACTIVVATSSHHAPALRPALSSPPGAKSEAQVPPAICVSRYYSAPVHVHIHAHISLEIMCSHACACMCACVRALYMRVLVCVCVCDGQPCTGIAQEDRRRFRPRGSRMATRRGIRREGKSTCLSCLRTLRRVEASWVSAS